MAVARKDKHLAALAVTKRTNRTSIIEVGELAMIKNTKLNVIEALIHLTSATYHRQNFQLHMEDVNKKMQRWPGIQLTNIQEKNPIIDLDRDPDCTLVDTLIRPQARAIVTVIIREVQKRHQLKGG